MNCRTVVEFLLDYFSGELSSPVRKTFEEHLASCPPCRTYLETYSSTIRLARESVCDEDAGAEFPPEMIEAIRASLRQERGADRRETDVGPDDRADG